MRLILTSISERVRATSSLGAGIDWIAAFAALSLVSGATAFGHGGAYRGPGGEVTGESREPSDPPPPADGGPPGTPSGDNPGGPNTGDGGSGGPKTGDGGGGTPSTGDGGPPANPPGNGPGGPNTKGGRAGGGKGTSLTEWTFWWNYNKDSLIGSRRRNARLSAGTGTFLHGIGSRASGTGVISVSEAEVANTLVPALLELLNASPKTLNSDIQSAAELALAKIGTPDLAAKLIEIAESPDGVYDRITVESAALALGILQRESPEVRAALTSLIADRKRDGSFVRPFAALSLGLLGGAARQSDATLATSAALYDVIAGKESSQDIKPAAILALGLMGGATDVGPLLAMARTAKTQGGKEKLSDSEVAHAIAALGRIGAAGLPGAG